MRLETHILSNVVEVFCNFEIFSLCHDLIMINRMKATTIFGKITSRLMTFNKDYCQQEILCR